MVRIVWFILLGGRILGRNISQSPDWRVKAWLSSFWNLKAAEDWAVAHLVCLCSYNSVLSVVTLPLSSACTAQFRDLLCSQNTFPCLVLGHVGDLGVYYESEYLLLLGSL